MSDPRRLAKTLTGVQRSGEESEQVLGELENLPLAPFPAAHLGHRRESFLLQTRSRLLVGLRQRRTFGGAALIGERLQRKGSIRLCDRLSGDGEEKVLPRTEVHAAALDLVAECASRSTRHHLWMFYHR